MTETKNHSAKCLCEKVTIQAAAINPKFTVCHCDDCRQWGGGPFFAVQCGTEVKFTGQDNITEYASSSWANRAFCSSCGTHLYYRLKQNNSYNMPLGLFSDVDNLVMDMQYFSDKRPDHYCFSNQSKEMTRDEIFAYFASQVE